MKAGKLNPEFVLWLREGFEIRMHCGREWPVNSSFKVETTFLGNDI